MKKTDKTTKDKTTNEKDLPPFKDLVEVGEILPDSSGKVSYKVRVIERRSDKVRLIDVRQHINNPDKDKFSGFTQKGISLSDPDSIDELVELLQTARDELKALGKKAPSKKEKKDAARAKVKAKSK